MSRLVLDYLSTHISVKPKKHVLDPRLAPNTKVVFLDRQVIKYLLQPEKYSKPDIIAFREKVLRDYDKNSNIISVMTAFYEGGSGFFETEHQKRRTANLDLKGLDGCFNFARVDEKFFFKEMKKATYAFTMDSEILKKNKKFRKVINKTYEYYLELESINFNGMDVIDLSKKLKFDMNSSNVNIKDPIAQYCFSLLTNHPNAKAIFKVKGLINQTESTIQKKLYNAYSDLRILQFLNCLESYPLIKCRKFEFKFVTYDTALEQFNNELKSYVQEGLSYFDERMLLCNTIPVSINFDIFNQNIFKNDEFELFKKIFME